MSVATEWILAVHRFFWYPVFYALGLERDAIDAPIGGWRRMPAPEPARVARKRPASARGKRRKAA